jgi:hypothetical protein
MLLAPVGDSLRICEENTMSRKILGAFALALFVLLAIPAAAQQAPALSAEEREAILRPVLDYAEGWYEGDVAKMERALHPELVKRIVRTDPNSKRSVLDGMGASVLLNNVARAYGKNTPKEQQLKDAKILEVFGNAASVRVEMAGWVDFLHIAKFNGRWVIVNVLWELKPRAN